MIPILASPKDSANGRTIAAVKTQWQRDKLAIYGLGDGFVGGSEYPWVCSGFTQQCVQAAEVFEDETVTTQPEVVNRESRNRSARGCRTRVSLGWA